MLNGTGNTYYKNTHIQLNPFLCIKILDFTNCHVKFYQIAYEYPFSHYSFFLFTYREQQFYRFDRLVASYRRNQHQQQHEKHRLEIHFSLILILSFAHDSLTGSANLVSQTVQQLEVFTILHTTTTTDDTLGCGKIRTITLLDFLTDPLSQCRLISIWGGLFRSTVVSGLSSLKSCTTNSNNLDLIIRLDGSNGVTFSLSC
jgi:hypothetical protein